MSRIRFGVWAMVALFFVPLGGAQSYTVADLGTLANGATSGANAINNRGMVVGSADSGGGILHAYVWTAVAGMQDIGTLPGDNESFAYAVNDSGAVVGESESFTFGTHAFLWTQAGGMRDLGNLGGDYGARAYGINNSGQVIGFSYIAGNAENHAFLWTYATGMQDLGTLGGKDSFAYAINDSGEVTGYSLVPGVGYIEHAFVWTQAGGMQDLGTPKGETFSIGYGISPSGRIVGYSGAGTNSTGFSWTQGQGIRSLSTGQDSSASGINASNQIIGTFYFNYLPTAFVWSPSGHLQNLNDLIPPSSGWVLINATGINQRGQIVVGGTLNGAYRGALLTPMN